MIGRFIDELRGRLRRAVTEAQGMETHEIRGFRVVVENTRPDIETARVLARLDEALELIERHQPWRLAHLRRDLLRFRVARFPCRGAYFPLERTCLTELTFLARTDITAAPVASSIVHEGMHARVSEMGVSPEQRDSAREERLCRRAELEFGLSLPPALGAPVVERAAASLTLADADVAPAIDWTEALARQAAVDRGALGDGWRRRTARHPPRRPWGSGRSSRVVDDLDITPRRAEAEPAWMGC